MEKDKIRINKILIQELNATPEFRGAQFKLLVNEPVFEGVISWNILFQNTVIETLKLPAYYEIIEFLNSDLKRLVEDTRYRETAIRNIKANIGFRSE